MTSPKVDTRLEQYQRFTAVIQPQRSDDLKASVRQFVGQRHTFEASWLIEDAEPYAGSWACAIDRPEGASLDWVWMPSCDLIDIEIEDRRGLADRIVEENRGVLDKLAEND